MAWTSIVIKKKIRAFAPEMLLKCSKNTMLEKQWDLNNRENCLGDIVMTRKLKLCGHVKGYSCLERTGMGAWFLEAGGTGRPNRRWAQDIEDILGL